MVKRRKPSLRLTDFNYMGRYAYFVTCSTYKRIPYFKDSMIVNNMIPYLRLVAIKHEFVVYVYCFMPDHLHLLLAGQENSFLPLFMKSFKQRSGFYFRGTYGKPLWQRGYYEHVLRKEQSLKEVMLYILENPVRKGLIDNYLDYPFLGSFIFDIKTM